MTTSNSLWEEKLNATTAYQIESGKVLNAYRENESMFETAQFEKYVSQMTRPTTVAIPADDLLDVILPSEKAFAILKNIMTDFTNNYAEPETSVLAAIADAKGMQPTFDALFENQEIDSISIDFNSRVVLLPKQFAEELGIAVSEKTLPKPQGQEPVSKEEDPDISVWAQSGAHEGVTTYGEEITPGVQR